MDRWTPPPMDAGMKEEGDEDDEDEAGEGGTAGAGRRRQTAIEKDMAMVTDAR